MAQAAPVGRWRVENFVAGDPALELANTVSHRRDAALAEDRIADARDLADWARSLSLDLGTAHVVPADVGRVQVVREAVHDAFAAAAAGGEPPRAVMATLLRAAAEGFEEPSAPRLHAALAWRAVRALAALPRDRIRACPACGWLFLDTSKAGRRRWCAMATCGTTAKVRAFRARAASSEERS
ncbi:MAG: CGNR zinc finger domain-containing protein [Geminicoccaceae bacterium]